MPQEQSNVKDRPYTNISEPRNFKVVIHNDDFTTMEFVVMLLRTIFSYSNDKAETLMLKVHNSGKAIIGIYSYDIANSKANKATRLARENNYPLRLTVEAE